MKYIVLSDTHFGVKNNSITWMNSQLGFIYKEFIPYIQSLKNKGEKVTIIHCGDVFDSRSSINPLVASKVRKMFKDIIQLTQSPVYVIAGNHDFYSPNDDSINSLQLVLRGIKELCLVTTEHIVIDHENVLVPWYVFDDIQVMKSIVATKPKRIFCHTDLVHLSIEYTQLLKDITVYSGHIHTPQRKNNLITLGSTFALTFTDCNAERGFYEIDTETNIIHFHAAKNIIKFWRFHNEEIFSIDVDLLRNDYIELYIDKLNLLNDRYSERIAFITANVKNSVVIPNVEQAQLNETVEFANYDIEKICEQNIPDELKPKFHEISVIT